MIPIEKLKKLEGKILTIIEASFLDDDNGIRTTAVKSLVRQEIGELYSYADYGKGVKASKE